MSRKKSTKAPPEALPETSREANADGSPPAEIAPAEEAEPTTGDLFAGIEATLPEPEVDAMPEAAGELTKGHLRGLLEALVFASDRPVKASELSRLASAPVKQVREMMLELQQRYLQGGITLVEVANGWIFRTHPQYAPFVRQITGERPVRLTRAQVESLAIVAYRQPITRPEIDDIRGVDSGATLKLLLERELVRILGKKDEPGRPILYGTTSQFLEFFGLKSLSDLPPLREATELNEESQRIADVELEGIAMASERTSPPAREPVPSEGDVAGETVPPDETAPVGAESEPDQTEPVEEEGGEETLPPEEAARDGDEGVRDD